MSFKIAIFSDLHCIPKGHKRESLTWLHSDATRMPAMRHPVEALNILIKKEELRADILLCPGDITDSIDRQGFVSGWSYIEEISRSLRIDPSSIYSTLGNHDVNSHADNPTLAFEIAKSLRNNYPLPNQDYNSSFWGDNFCLIETKDLRLIIINSVYDSFNRDSSRKININPLTLEKIRESIKSSDNNKFGIAMSHHHPISHYNTDSKDIDFIDKGDQLLRLLDEYGFKLFVHGHKHQPMLRTLNGINILASGSFSCIENLAETESENMFHIIEIFGGKGIINSWVYGPISGWHKENRSKLLPNFTGFGFNGDIMELATNLSEWLNEENRESVKLIELKGIFDDIFFLTPEQQIKFQQILDSKFSLSVIPNLWYGLGALISKQLK